MPVTHQEHEAQRARHLARSRVLLYEALIACEGDPELERVLGLDSLKLQTKMELTGLIPPYSEVDGWAGHEALAVEAAQRIIAAACESAQGRLSSLLQDSELGKRLAESAAQAFPQPEM